MNIKKLKKSLYFFKKSRYTDRKTERSVCIKRSGSATVLPPEGNNFIILFTTQTQA